MKGFFRSKLVLAVGSLVMIAAAIVVSLSAPLTRSHAAWATAGTITEFPVPTAGSNPGGITLGPDGKMWFTEQSGNKIGRITTSGVITEFGLTCPVFCGPAFITAGPDGNLWFAESPGNNIG